MHEIDVLLPVRLPAPWLRDALTGLENQTTKRFRLVVVAHGSDEGLSHLLADTSLVWKLIQADRQLTLSQVLNVGLAACEAPLVARHDADDVSLPERLEKESARLLANDRAGAIASSVQLIDERGDVVGFRAAPASSSAVLRRMRWRNAIVHPTVMFKRDAVVELGGYSPRAHLTEDFELWLRLLRLWDIDSIAEPLVQYRLHSQQVTHRPRIPATSTRVIWEGRQALARHREESETMALLRHYAWVTRQSIRSLELSIRR